ncbi:MAG: acyl transferase [Cytophagaceae bacterium]|nr:acyl transferase [Cytophagaceae bacterium]
MEGTTTREQLKKRVLAVTPESFDALALDAFRFQATENSIYRQYLNQLRINPRAIAGLEEVPFLPLDFFKSQRVLSGAPEVQLTFESSGTTSRQTPSRHYVADPEFYRQISQQLFEARYGSLRDWCILALLPSYLERGPRGGSSLVYMVQHFIEQSTRAASGFFLQNTQQLRQQLLTFENQPGNQLQSSPRILLIGVTFALLDLAESGIDWSFLGDLPNLVVMETGGMKGRRREMLREEVHDQLMQAFGVKTIHSEYGMTELLSQAYSPGEGIFDASPTMKILLRDVNDPFTILPPSDLQKPAGRGKTGGINVVDLANIDSCCFLETKDLGSYAHGQDSFRVLGRFDNSDIRGCNLMVE